MQRGRIALIAGMTIGLGVAAPALASDTLVTTGEATSITAHTADLNGVVYRDRVGARWLFQYSTRPHFGAPVTTTTPVAAHGRLTAVERTVAGLAPATRYYWRIVLVVRLRSRTARTFGSTSTLTTAATSTSTSTSPAPPTS